MSDTELDARAAAILAENHREGSLGPYTVPTRGLYPFQWNWDSALTALGWARLDPGRAVAEIETLLGAQWSDGMVPQIVFHTPDEGYFPGPERWGTEPQWRGRTPPTSGITQPPVAASCLRRILEGAPQSAALAGRVRDLLPRLRAWHAWFHTARDPDATGLVTSIHPWETGMDNSPAFDEALAAVEVPADLEPYRRRDLLHVDASMRPTAAEYDRYISLVQSFKKLSWSFEIERESSFRVADAATNFILLRADRDLLHLCRRFDQEAAVAEIEGRLERSHRGIRTLRDPATGMWKSLDRRRGALVPTATHAGFLAFWAGIGDAPLARRLEEWLEGSSFAVPSLAAGDPRFDARRYWRGPIWAVINFMLGEGLREAGETELAARVRRNTADLVRQSGFFEYFDPLQGSGCGGDAFTWTAAVWLAWAGKPIPSD